MRQDKKIPVILDTDIGDDIDDTWALALLLQFPELDLKLVVTETGNTTYRAKIVAKMLQLANRTDVPVGIGIHLHREVGPQAPWVEGYGFSAYPGTVYPDGITALIDTIMSSPEQVTLIAIGPVTNLRVALEQEPRIAEKVRFVGMYGSLRKGDNGSGKVSAEYNVKTYPEDCRKVFTAAWDMTITPLDTCGLVKLRGDKYVKVRDSQKIITRALMENYRIWAEDKAVTERESSILYDTVAVYLAFSEELLVMENLGVRVTDDGYTRIDDKAKIINCATGWKDLAAFEDFLVERLG